jgi:hypothetical protein
MPDLFFTGEIKMKAFKNFRVSITRSQKRKGKVAKFLYMVSMNSQKKVDD